ncbi:thiolase family protein [Haloferax sp. YSMS24]|uniref:thiolase family protein n=1 Tax=Haloferax sp. YSMS24 TaxID=3388425 RepID=UPI00398D2719
MTRKNTPVIVGAGTTEQFGQFPDRSILELATEALKNALEDTGIGRDELDGLVTNMGSPLSRHYDRLCEALALDVGFTAQYWAHGRWVGSGLQHAAMAVETGVAEYVAVGLGLKFTAVDQMGGEESVSLSEIGSIGEHSERPWYGMTAPVGGNALATRYYMEKYGATSEDLAHISKTFREHAALDPRSHFSKPIDIEDHQASRYIVDPLRLFDCAPLSDGGAYLIVTTAENAASLPNDPAYVASMEGLHAGRENHLFARPGMGIRTQREYEYDASVTDPVYERAGVTRDDIDALYTYDAFTPNVWYALERWGFCEPGTAFEFARDGNISLDGELPMNTHGGLLSNGHISAWNHLVEMYNQLRGEADKRQIANADTVQFATPFGDSIILRNEEP